jgi:GAF domain-containing protein
VPEDGGPLPARPEGLEQLGAVLLSEHSLNDLLQLVVTLARRTVPGVDGVSVSIARDGKLLTSNYSDDVVRELDHVQYQLSEGPCLDAMLRGVTTSLELEADGVRYPTFAKAARQRFILSVLSLPLAVRQDVIGALNLYSGTVEHHGEDEAELAALFAQQASIMLANGLAYDTSTSLNETLREALATREVIGEAKGIIMARERCSPDEAFDRLRVRSQRENRKLRVIAEELVDLVRQDGKLMPPAPHF